MNFVDVEENGKVDESLETPGNDCDYVIEPLIVVAINPVENVESAVQGHGQSVVDDVGLGLSRLDDHHKLGDQGDTLQVDGEGPEDLHRAELMVNDEGQEETGDHQKLDAEGVTITV